MDEIKQLIANSILDALKNKEINIEEIKDGIEIPKDSKNGDFSYPCFKLSKLLKSSPVNIANDIKENIVRNSKISEVQAINGYLNFYIDNPKVLSSVLDEIAIKGENYSKEDYGKGETVVIEYSSPNIAKPFHLGHFRNTVLGAALCRLYKNMGYNVISLNYLGDWGRQFGLLIEGYNLYKDEYNIEEDPLRALSDIYVRINKLAKEDENVMNKARENFKKLEEGNEEYKKLWEYFREISLKEYDRIYDLLKIKYDSYNGEAFFSKKADEVLKILEDKNVLTLSEGAKVVDVGENMPPCIVLKSNGSTIYATRDLAAILYRVRNYDFKKLIYITGNEQILHFRQIFKVAEYLVDKKYVDGLVHIPYGMIRLKTGKMSTREGTIIYIDDLIKEAIEKSKKIIKAKNSEIASVDEIATKVGLGALIFNYLKTSKSKDIIFDLDETLRFDGETGPYVQYTYVRTKSILEKSKTNLEIIKSASSSLLTAEEEVNLLKEIGRYKEVLKKATCENEPAHVARYLIDISTAFSKFYNECPILNVEDELKNARLYLTYCVGIIIKNGLGILGIDCPDKM